MGYDRKYGKVLTQFGNIAEDEPVVVFRARDLLLIDVLAYYADRCEERGSPNRHLKIINNTLYAVVAWQTQNPDLVRVPTSESSRDRLEE